MKEEVLPRLEAAMNTWSKGSRLTQDQDGYFTLERGVGVCYG